MSDLLRENLILVGLNLLLFILVYWAEERGWLGGKTQSTDEPSPHDENDKSQETKETYEKL